MNVERLRSDLRRDRWFGSLDASFTGRTGNVEALVLGGTALVGANWRRHLGFAAVSVDYARYASQTQLSKSFAHVRYNYRFRERLVGEIFAQQQTDRFQRLGLRQLYGVGPRFTLIDETDLDVFLGSAYMFEYQRVSGEPDDTAHRWSNYLSMTWGLDSRTRLIAAVYVQPRFGRMSDWRALAETSLTFAITKRLSAKLSLIVRHDSDPPADVKPTDTELKNTLGFVF